MNIFDFDECSICFEKINSYSGVYDSKFSVGAICENCNTYFNDKEKEILIHVFNVARGAFKDKKSDLLRVKDILYDVQSELKLKKCHLTPESVFLSILRRSNVYCLDLNFFIKSNIKHQRSNSEPSCCVICNNELVNTLKHQNLGQDLEFVCDNCIQRYSNEDIKVMVCLFRRCGGFFGELRAEGIEIRQIATDLIERLERANNFSILFEINEVALHRALLHGYNPKDFIEELKKI